jgi:fucose permease
LSPRWATTGVFFVCGGVIGTWVAQIPWIQERFALSNAEVGGVLTGMALATVLTLPLAGQAVVRHGSGAVTRAGGLAACALVVLPVLAPRALLVPLALFALGMAAATMDVGMNAHGSKIEVEAGRPIMSSLHAGWSFGGMVGAGFGATGVALGLDPRLVVAVASALLLAGMVVCVRAIGPGSGARGVDTPGFTLPPRGVVLLALVCLLVMVTEGAMADWGGIYLRKDLGGAAALAALTFACFTAGMTVGRVAGDRVNARVGPVRLLRGGALLTGLPLAAMLLIGSPAVALAGLFLIGLGVANGVPLMFSAAGRREDAESGPAIAAVSSMGSLGFLASPPAIGFLADAVSLPWALSALVLGATAVFLLAGRTA